MNDTVQARVAKTLWGDTLAFSKFPAKRYRQDTQGWNSHHVYLAEAIEIIRPKVVIEIGVWKGGSTIRMAQKIKELEIDATVISVDTWLGSWEHWEQPQFFADLLFDNGYPSIYNTFMTNVVESEVQDYIVPLPLDSANAAFVIQRKGIVADIIHIDGGHDYKAVIDDMQRWWELLRSGGMLIMDDYDPEGRVWPSVRDAVDHFKGNVAHDDFASIPYKARLRKPL